MPTTATGPFAGPLWNLQELICASAAFRTQVAAADATAARAYVYWLDGSPADNVTSWAWIKLKEGWQGEFKGEGAFWNTMPLQVLFQRPDVKEDDVKERQIKFWNWIGSVVAQMQALAGTGTYLNVTRFNLSDHTMADPQDNQGLFQQAFFDVQVF